MREQHITSCKYWWSASVDDHTKHLNEDKTPDLISEDLHTEWSTDVIQNDAKKQKKTPSKCQNEKNMNATVWQSITFTFTSEVNRKALHKSQQSKHYSRKTMLDSPQEWEVTGGTGSPLDKHFLKLFICLCMCLYIVLLPPDDWLFGCWGESVPIKVASACV